MPLPEFLQTAYDYWAGPSKPSPEELYPEYLQPRGKYYQASKQVQTVVNRSNGSTEYHYTDGSVVTMPPLSSKIDPKYDIRIPSGPGFTEPLSDEQQRADIAKAIAAHQTYLDFNSRQRTTPRGGEEEDVDVGPSKPAYTPQIKTSNKFVGPGGVSLEEPETGPGITDQENADTIAKLARETGLSQAELSNKTTSQQAGILSQASPLRNTPVAVDNLNKAMSIITSLFPYMNLLKKRDLANKIKSRGYIYLPPVTARIVQKETINWFVIGGAVVAIGALLFFVSRKSK